MSRAELFAGLFILGCTNGLVARVNQSVHSLGWSGAIFSAFNISVVVWAACFAGVALILRDNRGGTRSIDFAVGAILATLVILPIVSLSWLAVTVLCLYILLFSDTLDDAGHRGAIILLATTVPMLWSPMLFNVFSKFILECDAAMVSWVLGTRRSGNIVEFADHSANMVVGAACSSLANMSLAFLCLITINQLVRHIWRLKDIMWCLLACVSVIAVNVTRISLMGLSLPHYTAIHSPTGDAVVGCITLTLVVGISVIGARREIFARA